MSSTKTLSLPYVARIVLNEEVFSVYIDKREDRPQYMQYLKNAYNDTILALYVRDPMRVVYVTIAVAHSSIEECIITENGEKKLVPMVRVDFNLVSDEHLSIKGRIAVARALYDRFHKYRESELVLHSADYLWGRRALEMSVVVGSLYEDMLESLKKKPKEKDIKILIDEEREARQLDPVAQILSPEAHILGKDEWPNGDWSPPWCNNDSKKKGGINSSGGAAFGGLSNHMQPAAAAWV